MQGLMMDRPLRVSDILTYAEETFPEEGITSQTVEGGLHRLTYAQMGRRVRKLAQAMHRLGLNKGDRIATLAWNGYRHMELYYGIPGIGAVCHTLNPRLSAEQMQYITYHAGDKAMFLDLTFVPLIEAMVGALPKMVFVILTDAAHMPDTSLPNVYC